MGAAIDAHDEKGLPTARRKSVGAPDWRRGQVTVELRFPGAEKALHIFPRCMAEKTLAIIQEAYVQDISTRPAGDLVRVGTWTASRRAKVSRFAGRLTGK